MKLGWRIGSISVTSCHLPVGHCFDEKRLVFSHSPASGFLCSIVHCKHIVSINADGQHTVTWAASSCSSRRQKVWPYKGDFTSQTGFARQTKPWLTDTVSPVLLIGWRRNGVTIVAAEEYQGAFEGSREVESGVSVPFTGRSLSKITDDSAVHVFSLECVCGSGSYSKAYLQV